MIKIGDAIPKVTLKILFETVGLQTISTEKIFQGNVMMFGSPGAYLPDCSEKHLPGYLEQSDQLKRSGIDQIVCLAVNDPFVMDTWRRDRRVGNKIMMLPDGNAEFTKAMGLEIDGTSHGLGIRCNRFSMFVKDGIVKDLQVEQNPTDVDVTSAICMMGRLKNY